MAKATKRAIDSMRLWVASNVVRPLGWLECGYRNSSDRMVIARCVGPEEFFLERVVFPFELLSFSCPADSELKIWTHGLGGPELLETVAVDDLVIETGSAAIPLTQAAPELDESHGTPLVPQELIQPPFSAPGPEAGPTPRSQYANPLTYQAISAAALVQAWGTAG